MRLLLAGKTKYSLIQLEAQPGSVIAANEFHARQRRAVVATRQVDEPDGRSRMMLRTVDVIFISLYYR